jgi:hypothetical protein
MAFFEEARERDQSRQLPRRLAAGVTLENAKQDRSGKKSKGRLRGRLHVLSSPCANTQNKRFCRLWAVEFTC